MVTDTQVKTGYKQTDVGLIPNGWTVTSLGEVTSFTNGKAHENYVNENGDYILVNSKFISTEGEVRKFVGTCLQPLKKDEITMVMSDVPNGRAIAKCFYVDKNNKYALNQRICALKSLSDNPKYLFYQIDRNPYFLSFDDGVKQTNLRKEDVLNCPLPIPSDLHEQDAIVQAITNVSELVEKLDQLIEKKRNIKQGAMQELLTGKRRLPGFSGEWVETELKNIADFLKGQGLSKGRLSLNGKNQCVLYGELFTTYTRSINDIKSRTDTYEGLLSRKGDILMPGSTTTIGIDLATASALELDNILLGGDIIVIRKNNPKNYNSYFLANYLTHVSKYKIAEIAQGITIIHLHGSRLKEIAVNIPSDIEEQNAIAEILYDMDTEISELESQKNKYLEIKQGMMQQLLTGRIRLV